MRSKCTKWTQILSVMINANKQEKIERVIWWWSQELRNFKAMVLNRSSSHYLVTRTYISRHLMNTSFKRCFVDSTFLIKCYWFRQLKLMRKYTQSIKSERDQTFSLFHSNNETLFQFFYETLYASLKNQHHAIVSTTQFGKDKNWIYTLKRRRAFRKRRL